MLNKEELFETEQLWFSPKEEVIYNFIDESTGYFRDEKNETEGAFSWSFSDKKKIIKITFPNETDENDITYFYKLVVKENQNYLFKKYNEDKKLLDEIVFIREQIELPVSYRNFQDMDKVDKITFFSLTFLAFIIFLLSLSFAPIIRDFSGIYTIIFAIIPIFLLYKEIMSLSFLISRKHKNYLKKFLKIKD